LGESVGLCRRKLAETTFKRVTASTIVRPFGEQFAAALAKSENVFTRKGTRRSLRWFNFRASARKPVSTREESPRIFGVTATQVKEFRVGTRRSIGCCVRAITK
jgi:hypothetical protein